MIMAILNEYFPVQKKSNMISNLKNNWYFPISAMAFYFLSATLTVEYIAAVLIAVIMATLISTQVPSLWLYANKHSKRLRILSLITAAGISLGGQAAFYADWRASPKTQALEAMLHTTIDIPGVVSAVGAVAALFFIYCCVLAFWDSVIKVLKNTKLFSEIKVVEWLVYGILFALSITYMIALFLQTDVFYGTEHLCDIIYTSDSPYLVKQNVYLALAHPENDLRQPLFAVFAAPFCGIPYLVARLINAPESIQAIMINSVQVLMLYFANFLLAKMLRLDPVKRVCFMVLSSFTYMQMLFVLMMEQYIVAYFWLVLCIYFLIEGQQRARIALWGAGGTLITSLVLVPFMPNKSPIRNFKEWFLDIVRYGIEFVILMVVFCRFDVIFSLAPRISFLSNFTGETVSFADKIYQYIEFVCNCFIAPNAGVNTTAVDYISWQQNAANGINFIGVFLLILTVISAIWNREKKSSQLAAVWIGLSVAMLLIIGWGTKENGLILYTLYFGWAYLILLFQLVEKIENKLNTRYFVPITTICVVAVLLVINVPAIMEMLKFAITHYPV